MHLLGEVMRLKTDPVGGYAVVVVAALALLALLLLGPSRDRTTPFRRRVLALVRLAVVVLLILAMLRPTLVWTRTTKQAATLLVLLDRSRSMLVVDAVGRKSRWDALRSALEEALPGMARLAKEVEVKVYAFDSEPHSLDFSEGKLDPGGPPEGMQTAIGAVLDDVLQREAGKRLAGVVLLGDGAQRAYAPRDMPPHAAARRMADLGARLYTVPFGQARGPGQARDIALEELLTNAPVFVKNQLEVTGTVRVEGFVNQDLPVQLLVEAAPGKMEVVGTRRLKALEDGQRLPVDLDYVPQVPGEIKVTLKAATRPGEMVTTNNEISTFVTVLKGGLNVLYLNGALQPEQKYLRWSLDASRDIKVDYFRIDAQQKETRPTDLIDRFKPGAYDVYILGDLDSTAFNKEELAALTAAVERGAGFIMLGGIHSFGAGGYGRTPLADVLPIEINRLERQNFGEPTRPDLHLAGRLRMLPTRLGSTQSLMLLADRAGNQAAWEKLPPLEGGANRFSGVKPGASVLAESQAGDPLLVAGNHGNGRVIALAVDSTWHWWMDGFESAHRRFWRQVVLWLARKDESTEGNVWIKLEQRRFGPGTRVEFSAGAETAEGEPITDGLFEATVTLPDGKTEPIRLRRQGEQMVGSFAGTQASGDYTLAVTAR
ncbi:MAG: glutamine amidotransferase, partial [Pirellulales bacterium]